jgi:hypothetical protein
VSAELFISGVYRQYAAMARGEHFEYVFPGRPGESPDDLAAAIERLIQPATRKWQDAKEAREIFCSRWQLTEEQYDELMIFPKPGYMQNLFYSTILRRLHGIDRLKAAVPEFARGHLFRLHAGSGYYVPHREDGLIRELVFYNYKGDPYDDR